MYNQKTNNFKFDYNKAIQSLLYVTKDIHNLYNIVKVFYFADKLHLSRYGRFIFGDKYIAMPKGPVPSKIYDILKFIRGDQNGFQDEELKKMITYKSDKEIKANIEANVDFLSETDIECLNESIKKYGDQHHSSLFRKSHDKAYKSTPLNGIIKLEKIIETLDNSKEVKEYLDNIYV